MTVIGEGDNDRFRRISPVAAHSGDRLLSEPTAGTQPCRLVGGNRSSCPGADLRDHLRERREVGWETVLAGHPTTANSGIREDGTKR